MQFHRSDTKSFLGNVIFHAYITAKKSKTDSEWMNASQTLVY